MATPGFHSSREMSRIRLPEIGQMNFVQIGDSAVDSTPLGMTTAPGSGSPFYGYGPLTVTFVD